MDIISAINNKDFGYLNENLHITNIDTALNNEGLTPLITAILARKKNVIHYLLHLNANPNLNYKGFPPLIYAIKTNSVSATKLLLKVGAKVNYKDSYGNTPLMIASQSQKKKILRVLLKYGASLNIRNNMGLTSYDFSITGSNTGATHFLTRYFETHLPDYFDGPYVRYRSKQEIDITYLKHDSLRKKYIQFSSTFNTKKTNFHFKGFIGDTSTYYIPNSFKHPPSTYNNVKNIVVIGDIHGQCDSLKKFLIANNITDANLSWKFNKGHLVFLGDIFDRGNQVTETLWLIYKLEAEAEKQGGKVHLLLGNHEIMAMEGDERYLSNKYRYLYKYFHLDNKKNYSTKMLIGRWLRSKNIIEKINDILFVHGGIHPHLLNFSISIDSINNTIRHFINTKREKDKTKNYLIEFLFGDNGPFWYRGMIQNKILQKNDVKRILDYYKINKIIVGHTNLPNITPLYNKTIYGLDIPFYIYTGVPMEALLVAYNGYFKLNTSGTVEKIE